MSATVQVPVEVSAEAAELIEELKLRPTIDEMIEHTRQTVAGLHSVELEVWYERDDDPPSPNIAITGWRDGHSSSPADYAEEAAWSEWAWRTFPPEVKGGITFAVRYRGDYGR